MTILPIFHYFTYTFFLKRLEECTNVSVSWSRRAGLHIRWTSWSLRPSTQRRHKSSAASEQQLRGHPHLWNRETGFSLPSGLHHHHHYHHHQHHHHHHHHHRHNHHQHHHRQHHHRHDHHHHHCRRRHCHH